MDKVVERVAEEVRDQAAVGEILPEAGEAVEELPIGVVGEEEIRASEAVAEIIDKHLDFESELQGRELRPMTLCPEQKVSMVSDLAAI